MCAFAIQSWFIRIWKKKKSLIGVVVPVVLCVVLLFLHISALISEGFNTTLLGYFSYIIMFGKKILLIKVQTRTSCWRVYHDTIWCTRSCDWLALSLSFSVSKAGLSEALVWSSVTEQLQPVVLLPPPSSTPWHRVRRTDSKGLSGPAAERVTMSQQNSRLLWLSR